MPDKQVVLVTGANQGIGLQIAKELAARNFTVLVGSRNLKRGEEAAKALTGDARPQQLDVTDRVSIATAAERIRADFGHLDLLINNAALQQYAALGHASNASLDEVRAIWDTNVFGVLAVFQAMLPLLKLAPAARIVNVSSGVGSLTTNANRDFPYRTMFGPGYAASKTALNAITLSMAIELEDTPIKVNAVSPGFTKTGLNGYEGTETVEQGAAEAVRVALLGPDSPTGTFTSTHGSIPW